MFELQHSDARKVLTFTWEILNWTRIVYGVILYADMVKEQYVWIWNQILMEFIGSQSGNVNIKDFL